MMVALLTMVAQWCLTGTIAVALLSEVAVSSTWWPLLSCNLSGIYTYLPEPGSRYEWSALSPSLVTVAKAGGNAGDPWSNATGACVYARTRALHCSLAQSFFIQT